MIANYKFQKCVISMAFLLLWSSCESTKDENSNITVTLERTDKSLEYYDNRQSQLLLLSMKDVYPEFYKQNLEKLKGIPNLDSFQVVTENLHKGYYRTALFPHEYDQKGLRDSLKMTNEYSEAHINIISGFKSGKQVLILDSNNNNDFSDEEIFVYDNKFRFFESNNPNINDNLAKVDSITPVELEYKLDISNSKQIRRKIQVYPFSNHFYTQLLRKKDLKDYAIGLRLKDYWTGELSLKNVDYSFTIQGANNKSSSVSIKPKKINYKATDQIFNKNFSYKVKDTVQLAEELFIIDSLESDFSEIHLSRILNQKPFFGSRMGNTVKDFQLQNLNGNNFTISEVNSKKEFTLLDFWGTWCAPCKELTPDLVSLSNQHSEKLNIIGIASDENVENVKKYTLENKMEWFHAFEELKKGRRGIKNGLQINSYPTFILLDKNSKIIYRGGSGSLKAIEDIIER